MTFVWRKEIWLKIVFCQKHIRAHKGSSPRASSPHPNLVVPTAKVRGNWSPQPSGGSTGFNLGDGSLTYGRGGSRGRGVQGVKCQICFKNGQSTLQCFHLLNPTYQASYSDLISGPTTSVFCWPTLYGTFNGVFLSSVYYSYNPLFLLHRVSFLR